MNRKKILCFTVFFSLLAAMTFAQVKEKPVNYVNPFIGTGGHGHTFPGATVPFGMVQLSPDTYDNEWDWCSGYHITDNSIMGFSHTHLSGTGCADYGDILFMPTTGAIKLIPGSRENPTQGYRSRFKHENEKATPGYYSVLLDDYKVKVELTATTRAGFHKYTFPKTEEANIIIDLTHGIGESTLNAGMKIISNTEIEGFRRSHGWNNDHTVYFVAKFSKPFNAHGLSLDGKINTTSNTAEGKTLKGYLRYSTTEGEVVLVKVGISHVSIEGARKNLDAEIKGWNFAKVKTAAEATWEKELSRIAVEGGTNDQKTCFYTALYHSFIAPNVFSDVDGRHRGMDGKVYQEKGFTEYTVFSLWDTFRALHPLFTLVEQKRTNDIINTFYSKYKESGLLPVWELASWETNCMIGYHSIPVIYDAYKKGLRGYNAEKLFEAMKHSAEQDAAGLKSYKELGYVESDKTSQSVSRTLEYAYDDWCIAMMAKDLGKQADYERYSKRALSYRNLFDGTTGFMRAKVNGNFVTPFNSYAVTGDYTEANAWQYSLFVPHDLNGLVNLFGSKEKLANRLNELFTTTSKLEGHEQNDISGLIGQYAHGNEPSHHMAYLFNYVGQGWKTQEMVRKVMDELYLPKPDGLSGNEDCGQMSAWYVLSAMGFYPACPGTNEYVIGSPLFKKVTINLENGKKFVINAPNSSKDNKYITSVTKNNKPYEKAYIRHEDILKGCTFTFNMSNTPNKNWATSENDAPYSFTTKKQVSVPFSTTDETMFLESTTTTLGCSTDGVSIYYTTDGTTPSKNSNLYTAPIKIDKTLQLRFIAYKDGYEQSLESSASFKKATFVEPQNIAELTPGLNYAYYEGYYDFTTKLKNLTPKKTGITDIPSLKPAERVENYGLIFTGYINIPQDGIYTFFTNSDDGSVMFIDDQRVVDNDGPHSSTFASGKVALKAGYHSFKALYCQGVGPSILEISVEYGGNKMQLIPKDWFFIKK